MNRGEMLRNCLRWLRRTPMVSTRCLAHARLRRAGAKLVIEMRASYGSSYLGLRPTAAPQGPEVRSCRSKFRGATISMVAACAWLVGGCGSDDPSTSPSGDGIAAHGALQLAPLVGPVSGRLTLLDPALAEVDSRDLPPLVDVDRYGPVVVRRAAAIDLFVTGRYHDPIGDRDGPAPVTLKAFGRAGAGLNVNILTTIAAPRARALARSGLPLDDATARAEGEFQAALPMFGTTCAPPSFTTLDMTGGAPGDLYLARATLLLLQASADSGVGLDELLRRLAADFEDGDIDDVQLISSLRRATRTLAYSAAADSVAHRYLLLGKRVQLPQPGLCPNDSPVIPDLIPLEGLVGTSVTLDAGETFDPDDASLTYAWTLRREQSDRPYFGTPPYDTVELAGSRGEFALGRVGSWAVRLTVRDPGGREATRESRIFAFHSFTVGTNGTAVNDQTGATWQLQDDGIAYTLAEARGRDLLGPGDSGGLDVCGNLVLGAYSDWRVPRLPEVQTLLDFRRDAPRVAAELAPYSRTTLYISDSWVPNSQADYIDTADGEIHHVSASTRTYVRCVRP